MTRRVEFSETDMAGIMHFSNYFRYMEATEHEFFRSQGLSVHAQQGGRMLGWARVRAECEYFAPLRYEDIVEIRLLVREKKPRSISYDFHFRKLGPDDEPAGPRVARGRVTVVCVGRAPGDDAMRATTMPEDIDARIEVAPAERLARAEEENA